MRFQFLLLICLPLMVARCSVKKSDAYILPRNFVGFVLIIHCNEFTQQTDRDTEGDRVLYVPASGILKTEFIREDNLKYIDLVYYEFQSEKNKIPVITDPDHYSSNKVNCTIASVGCTKNKNGDEIQFTVFFVGTKQQIHQYQIDFEKFNFENVSCNKK